MLSTTSEYALRALVQLARLPQGQPMLGRELSIKAEVPRTYLSKILLTLRTARLLEATRGTHGGYRLLRHPESIYLIEVVELFEVVHRQPRCVLANERECSSEHPCTAHAMLHEAREALMHALIGTTLQQIAYGDTDDAKERRLEGGNATPF